MSEINYNLDELESFFCEEELAKTTRKQMEAMFQNMALLRDPNSTKATRDAAIKALDANRKAIEAQKTAPIIIPAARRAMKEEAAAERAAAKQFKVSGKPATLGVTKSPTQDISPTKPVEKDISAHAQHIIDNALHLTHDLVQGKNHDLAHKVFSSIPKDALSKDLQSYHPDYTHFGISPHMWTALPADDREATHLFYDDAVAGKLDHDPEIKTIADRIRAIKKPTPAAVPTTTAPAAPATAAPTLATPTVATPPATPPIVKPE